MYYRSAAFLDICKDDVCWKINLMILFGNKFLTKSISVNWFFICNWNGERFIFRYKTSEKRWHALKNHQSRSPLWFLSMSISTSIWGPSLAGSFSSGGVGRFRYLVLTASSSTRPPGAVTITSASCWTKLDTIDELRRAISAMASGVMCFMKSGCSETMEK